MTYPELDILEGNNVWMWFHRSSVFLRSWFDRPEFFLITRMPNGLHTVPITKKVSLLAYDNTRQSTNKSRSCFLVTELSRFPPVGRLPPGIGQVDLRKRSLASNEQGKGKLFGRHCRKWLFFLWLDLWKFQVPPPQTSQQLSDLGSMSKLSGENGKYVLMTELRKKKGREL